MIQRSSIAFTLKSPFLRTLGFLLFCLLLSNNFLAQKPNYSPLVCTVLKSQIITNDGQVVTNVLSVKNENGITREFYIEIGCPSDWNVLSSSRRVYTVDPNDSIFIPLRILPNLKTMKGSTLYNVSVFVVGTDGRTHAVCSFNVGKPRKVDWKMSVLPRQRIYFLNDESHASFGINVQNNGEEPLDVNLSWKVIGQGLTLKTDSLKPRNFLDFLLTERMDTSVFFFADLSKPVKNITRVDIDSYNPNYLTDARKYTIYFSATEPKNVRGRATKNTNVDLVKLNSSVDFVKLSNSYTFNRYASSFIPVKWYSNVYNILGIQPILMNVLNAEIPINGKGIIFSNIQHVFTFYSPSQNTYRNLIGNIAYIGQRLNLFIGGGSRLMVPGLGTYSFFGGNSSGISASYKITNKFSLAVTAGVAPKLIGDTYTSRTIGLGSSYKFNSYTNFGLGYLRTSFLQNPSTSDDIFSAFRFRFARNHVVNARFGINFFTANIGTPIQNSNLSWQTLINYSGSYFKGVLRQSFGFNRRSFFNSSNQTINNSLFLSSATTLLLNKEFSTSFTLGYSENTFQSTLNQLTSITVPITLSFSKSNKNLITPIPALTYVYTEIGIDRLSYYGINMVSSYYNPTNNIRLVMSMLAGYNKLTDSINHKSIFSANSFLLFNYKTFGFNLRYAYGPLGLNGVKNVHYTPSRYPQYIFSSVNYQHVFKFTRLIGELSLNHSWNNQTYASNFNLGPQLYFYPGKQWRFNIQFLYNLTNRNNDRAVEFYENQGYTVPENEDKFTTTSNFNISFGIKKEFGVPIPKKLRKSQFVNANFVAFLDFNGNKIMDNDEVPLENIVIKVNGHEVLTDKDGKGKFVNIPVGTYEHKIIPLVDLDGWFTYTMDSIDIVGEQYYVPFTRGVKVAGSIVLDREKFTKDVLSTIDLSGIKIFTTDTLGNTMATMTDFNGNFSFYVPYGAYILSMDEEVIGDRFYIAQNHIPMDLYDGMDGFYQSFFIIEKRRTVKKKKFNEKGELIMVEEVDGGADRNNNNTTINNFEDSTVIHNNNNTYNIFNEDRKGNGGTNVNADDLYRELDERIDRLDAIIRALLKGEITDDNRKVLAEALRQLKNEEEAKRLNGAGPQPVMETMDASRHFHLVVGGFVYRENAERFVAKLKAQGFNEAVIIGVFNGYFLVRLKDYSTLQEAIDAQQKYKFIVDGIWVHKWP